MLDSRISGLAAPGYRSALYAEAFTAFGTPRSLCDSGGWLLRRPIAQTGLSDAMGLYPLFCCADWSAVAADLRRDCADCVSVMLVSDPLGDYDEDLLRRSFDRVHPFKDHFIADLTEPLDSFVSKSHRQNARRALNKVDVELCETPMQFLDDWIELYAVLADKHDVHGMRAFSRDSFEQQFRVPGLVMFRASRDGETVGLDLWYVDGDIAQGHLAAFSKTGYACSASYATKWTLLNYFADKVRWVNFGGVAGATGQGAQGLQHFKTGWGNTTRRTYICGSVFDRAAYRDLTRGRAETSYFPAYREGEL